MLPLGLGTVYAAALCPHAGSLRETGEDTDAQEHCGFAGDRAGLCSRVRGRHDRLQRIRHSHWRNSDRDHHYGRAPWPTCGS